MDFSNAVNFSMTEIFHLVDLETATLIRCFCGVRESGLTRGEVQAHAFRIWRSFNQELLM